MHSLLPAARLPDLFAQDGLHELIGSAHETVTLDALSCPRKTARRIARPDAILVDHEALHGALAPFWSHPDVAAQTVQAVRNGATIWIGFQSSGYIPDWMKALCHAGLLAAVRHAERCGDAVRARRWSAYAARLSLAIRTRLVNREPGGAVLHAAAHSQWQSLTERLMPLLVLPDIAGCDICESDPAALEISRNTYRRPTAGRKWWCAHA